MVVELKKIEPSKTWARGTDQITSAQQAKPGLFPAVRNYESKLWKKIGLGSDNLKLITTLCPRSKQNKMRFRLLVVGSVVFKKRNLSALGSNKHAYLSPSSERIWQCLLLERNLNEKSRWRFGLNAYNLQILGVHYKSANSITWTFVQFTLGDGLWTCTSSIGWYKNVLKS